MKKLATLTLATFLTISITGCSTKKYFDPEDTTNIETSSTSISSSIKSLNRDGATLEDGKFISRLGVSEVALQEGFQFMNVSSINETLATNLKDKITVGSQVFDVNNVAIAASKDKGIIAILYSDNSIELRDQKNNVLFRDYLSISLANDTRITNPFFLGNLVLFPTLDGRIVVVAMDTRQAVKKISVDPEGQFNNIIYLDVMGDNETLVTATANKLVVISPRNIVSKDYEIKDVTVDGEFIYAATLDGKIIKLNKNLEEVGNHKFKFAKINALAVSKSAVYAAESQGYLIKISKDFTTTTVDDLNYDESEKIISSRNKFYIGDKVITLP